MQLVRVVFVFVCFTFIYIEKKYFIRDGKQLKEKERHVAVLSS